MDRLMQPRKTRNHTKKESEDRSTLAPPLFRPGTEVRKRQAIRALIFRVFSVFFVVKSVRPSGSDQRPMPPDVPGGP
jgi:hypothetical protein